MGWGHRWTTDGLGPAVYSSRHLPSLWLARSSMPVSLSLLWTLRCSLAEQGVLLTSISSSCTSCTTAIKSYALFMRLNSLRNTQLLVIPASLHCVCIYFNWEDSSTKVIWIGLADRERHHIYHIDLWLIHVLCNLWLNPNSSHNGGDTVSEESFLSDRYMAPQHLLLPLPVVVSIHLSAVIDLVLSPLQMLHRSGGCTRWFFSWQLPSKVVSPAAPSSFTERHVLKRWRVQTMLSKAVTVRCHSDTVAWNTMCCQICLTHRNTQTQPIKFKSELAHSVSEVWSRMLIKFMFCFSSSRQSSSLLTGGWLDPFLKAGFWKKSLRLRFIISSHSSELTLVSVLSALSRESLTQYDLCRGRQSQCDEEWQLG